MKFNKELLLFGLVPILVLFPSLAYAEDDEGEDVAKSMGWMTVGAGVVANIPFIAINKIRRYAIKAGGSTMQIGRDIGTVYKPILNFHIMLNSIGYFAGMSHGFLLSRHLDSISLSLAIVMSIMMVSGLLLKYTSSRHAKIFNNLLHGQFGLVLVLTALVILHISTGDD